MLHSFWNEGATILAVTKAPTVNQRSFPSAVDTQMVPMQSTDHLKPTMLLAQGNIGRFVLWKPCRCTTNKYGRNACHGTQVSSLGQLCSCNARTQSLTQLAKCGQTKTGPHRVQIPHDSYGSGHHYYYCMLISITMYLGFTAHRVYRPYLVWLIGPADLLPKLPMSKLPFYS